MQPIDVRLKAVAPIFVLAHALAGEFQAMFEVLDLVRESVHLRADSAQSLLALDHARVRIRIARQAQPIRPQPDAIAGNHRFARCQAAAEPERLAQGFGGIYR